MPRPVPPAAGRTPPGRSLGGDRVDFADLPHVEFDDDELDVLAREEHEQWLRSLAPGRRYGQTADLGTFDPVQHGARGAQ